ncbi:GTP pyrophosphokinase [Aneurinibacillus migulanus]|uniref:GTP pyrophosphokinase n=1 Tax=Aneurinibacillus migulanus TaxID=47500 RepID=A0A0D1YCG5_ANEMI|nr:HD domain-containing protein [Aneurinibacillus migulanus]KIV55294.1 GTP pyrophosphokinase [Aneurinibacillus migulanus]KIV56762.1 GTP pyrophosphokinase [Aneurinibacillus migulanus]KON96715.1 GTP pyrophosphokinase [Aneurinibacillus migulanus]KPD10008.1 GTP pyrophosphokinase [Aneurinibacillus migulanus]MED0895673.1 HD domain-containing protein [Aneurinibacillus migulanus]
MSTLEKAIIIATKAHEGVIDKGGNPYILHPLRVMIKQTSEECRIVAVLHDVVEDTDISLTDLRNEGFSEDIILAVDALTRRSNESYMEFISRCKQDAMARLVKLADIEDNSDMSRIKNPTQRDYDRLQKYKKAKDELLS